MIIKTPQKDAASDPINTTTSGSTSASTLTLESTPAPESTPAAGIPDSPCPEAFLTSHNPQELHNSQTAQVTTKSRKPQNSQQLFYTGLTSSMVQERVHAKLTNTPPKKQTRSPWEIIRDNIFTLFNFLHFSIAVMVIIYSSIRHCLFMGVVFTTTFMGIFQEIRAKKTIDKLSIVSQLHSHAIRDGVTVKIPIEKIVIDDILILNTGDQITVDGIVLSTTGLEVNESLITGESDAVAKSPGTEVSAGSFVSSGTGIIKVIRVGKDNSSNKICEEARRERKSKSRLMYSVNMIIKFLAIIIIPLSVLLFRSYYKNGIAAEESVTGIAASLIGMIPDGLLLLTNIAFAVGVINLAKYKTLVQTLPGIETLARVDILCLDKTGTITDGSIKFDKLIPLNGIASEQINRLISMLTASIPDKNSTAEALRNHFGNFPPAYSHGKTLCIVPFSSARKWSGATFSDIGSYLLGTPEYLCENDPDSLKTAEEHARKGYRVLAIARSDEAINPACLELPSKITPYALIVFIDRIRSNAIETFNYFRDQGVEIKVISGDNTAAVSHIAKQAGIENAEKCIDMSTLEFENTIIAADVKAAKDFSYIASHYTVFGRVNPRQKRELIRALKNTGKCVGMTGDGVNDVLALTEADCSVAMASGSDASRSVADLVLMDSDFSALVPAVYEGRRIINNIEKSASLYLVKTIYSLLLTIIYLILGVSYPFDPINLTLVGTLAIGIPTFFLTLESDRRKVKGNFLRKVVSSALPASVTIVLCILLIQHIAAISALTREQTITINSIIAATCSFALLNSICQPYNIYRRILYIAMIISFVTGLTLFGGFFNITDIFSRIAAIYVPVSIFAYFLVIFLTKKVFKN